MRTPRPTPAIDTLHILSLALWLAATLGSALAAAVLFPTLKSLHPRLPEYEAYQGEHFLVAAGTVAQKIFLIADMVHLPAALIAVITLVLSVRARGVLSKRPATAVRAVSLAVALACLGAMLLIVTPRLVSHTKQHFAAMQQNNASAIAAHKAAVDDIHPIASRLMGTMALSTLLSLASGAWSLASPPSSPSAPTPSPRSEH